MGRVVLVSDVQTPLGELARRTWPKGQRGRDPLNQQSASPLVFRRWLPAHRLDRRSPISARNVLLAVANPGRIDEAVVVQWPFVEARLLETLRSMERAVDAWLKGPLFLVKGLLGFRPRRRGRLALVD
jgi:hypothetical protein